MFADTFFQSVKALQPKEQAKAIDFVTRFQADPSNPGISLERLRTRSKDIWSGRITRDLRAIIHQDGQDWALLYADHHNAAYQWAERRRVGRHPVTGVIQVVEHIEEVKEVQKAVESAPKDKALFEEHKDDYLLSLGVPEDWLPTVRRVADEDQLFVVISKLPEDVGERLLSLATGEFVTPPAPVAAEVSAAEHPDTRRRFFVAEDNADLLRVLEAPLERWIAFLHPSQQKLVTAKPKGPMKVTGSAGTGKTVVAMHRARHLAREGNRVLLTSFVKTLCENVGQALGVLCSPQETARIEVSTVHSKALKLLRKVERDAHPADGNTVKELVERFARSEAPDFDPVMVQTEWEAVIQAQGIGTWDEYRKARRTGRGTPLSGRDRKTLWKAFGAVHAELAKKHAYDWPVICRKATDALVEGKIESPYDAVVVDEVQDLKAPELRFLAALCADHPENLLVAGDAGQRLYPGGFGLGALGINVCGRSHILRLNYRTTEQIRTAADRMLGSKVDDLDDGVEARGGTRSLLSGPSPTLEGYVDGKDEVTAAVQQVKTWLGDGLSPTDIAVFARTKRLLDGVESALRDADLRTHRLADGARAPDGLVRLGTMHRAKGLEFKAVLVFGAADGTLPSKGVLRYARDPQDREDAEGRERRLLYVAMTRARDELRVTWHGKPSPFLGPLLSQP